MGTAGGCHEVTGRAGSQVRGKDKAAREKNSRIEEAETDGKRERETGMQKLPRQQRNPLEREKRNFYVLQVIRARHGERGGVLDEDGKEKRRKTVTTSSGRR